MASVILKERFYEKAIGLFVVAMLFLACLKIIAPFLAAIVWATIITISAWPLYRRLRSRLNHRGKLAAVLLALSLGLAFVVPMAFIVISLKQSVTAVSGLAADLTTLKLPEPPPSWLTGIPLLGERLESLWLQFNDDAPALLEKARPQIAKATRWILSSGADLLMAMLEFLLAVVISGILFVTGEPAAAQIKRIAERVGGKQHVALLDVSAQTIRSVSLGIVGTALLQAFLSAFGFALAGVPGVALLGLICFLLAMLQVGTGLVWIPTAIWLGTQGQTGWAVFTVVWGIFINVMDNFIKPYFISHGSGLPMVLIFLGVLGGLLTWGFIGIFLGATLIAVSYTLLHNWLDQTQPDS